MSEGVEEASEGAVLCLGVDPLTLAPLCWGVEDKEGVLCGV